MEKCPLPEISAKEEFNLVFCISYSRNNLGQARANNIICLKKADEYYKVSRFVVGIL